MNKISKIALKYFLISLVFIGSFVFLINSGIIVAENYVNNTLSGTSNFSILQNDNSQVINLTLNNTGVLKVTAPDNVTEFNVTIPDSFKYIVNTQGSNVSSAFINNSATVLSWYNFTHGLLNASAATADSSIGLFWFNVSGIIGGNYMLNITVLNGTAGNTTKITTSVNITVNDTTVPAVTILSPTASSVHNGTIINISVIGLADGTDNLTFCKFSVDNWVTNVSMQGVSGYHFRNQTYSMSNGSKTLRFWCNDSVNNINSTESVTFTMRSWSLTGMTLDINGTPLNNSQVNVTIRDTSFSIVGYNSTNSSSNGWFNLTVAGNSNWFYQPVIRHFTNDGSDTLDIDGIGQTMPAFPYAEMSAGLNISSYLRDAGIINISLINGTHRGSPNGVPNQGPRSFRYQIKDQLTGFSIKESWTDVLGVEVQVPRDKNYSIMIYPNQSMPLSFNWNNFTGANITYNLTGDAGNISFYNITNHKLTKEFNASETLYLINGTVFNGSRAGDWNEFNITAYLLEAGNMIYVGSNAMNFFNNTNHFNVTNGTYNMSLAAPAEGANYLLFASARNGTNYYGGYRNISVTYGGAPSTAINFTMYPMMDNVNWGNTTRNITLRDTFNFKAVGMNATKQAFNIINSTNGTFNNIEATMELKVDYTNYNATSFTFMSNIGQGTASTFYFPLINATGIEEINVYSMNGAPKHVSKKTVQQILSGAGNNITLSAFNPGAIDGSVGAGFINVAIYKSNSTCDVPSPPASCVLTASSNMTTFNPLSAVMGGGKISFRMGKNGSRIDIHYVNVDMIASGPPDALFDGSATTSTSNGFESVLRFGSNGPKVYDYVLVSMPYTQGSSSVVGLNENVDVNLNIPAYYDENWNVAWNASQNGSSGSALAGNYSHYATYATQWETLMNGTNCTTSISTFSATNPCYINKTSNTIWIRLPHFSGNQPRLNASVTTVTASSDSSSTSGAGTSPFWTLTSEIPDADLKAGFSKTLKTKQRMKLNVNNEVHYVGIVSMTSSKVVINVSSKPQQAELSVGDLKKFDVNDNKYYDLSVKLDSISGSEATLTTKLINEKIVESQAETGAGTGKVVDEVVDEEGSFLEGKISLWLWIVIIIVIIALLVIAVIYYLKSRK